MGRDQASFGHPYEVTASCLTYLFADRFVRPIRMLRRSVRGEPAVTTPTTGTLVLL
jgi:hypothetical protein